MAARDDAAVAARSRELETAGLHLRDPGSASLGAWFLGPKAENAELLRALVKTVLDDHVKARQNGPYRNDPPWLTRKRKKSKEYEDAKAQLETQLKVLVDKLDGSVPFYSYRYQAHMLWDATLPSIVGYLAAMLCNQNNVAAEASPVTTHLEQIVGGDLCQMLGYGDAPAPWGHITCDGTVANIEALWAARNLKYCPLGVAAALREQAALRPARDLSVTLPDGREALVRELSSWELLNLRADDALALPERIKGYFTNPPDLDALLGPYMLQELGLLEFYRRYAPTEKAPVVLAPATNHYSWPKGAALLGIGRDGLLPVAVDRDARLDLADLRRKLDGCLAQRRPVLLVVAVVGTTVEGAVDPVSAIVEERERYRRLGLEFWLHVDAAWGGYFASMLRPPAGGTSLDCDCEVVGHQQSGCDAIFFSPRAVMSPYVQTQLQALPSADSITVDPHKSGFIPYPAGGLCYRNSAMRHLIAFSAPVVYRGEGDPTQGIYGIEGSKPGAAAAAVYLSHRVIRTDQSGYGRLLGRCLFNSKRFYAALVNIARRNDRFRFVAVQRLPQERDGRAVSEAELEAHRQELNQRYVVPDNPTLIRSLESNPEIREEFRDLGSDQLIVACAFNFRSGGEWNRRLELLNKLNTTLSDRLSIRAFRKEHPAIPIYVTQSELDPATHGPDLVSDFLRRLGVAASDGEKVSILVLTTMDPWLTDVGHSTPKGRKQARKRMPEQYQSFIPTLIQDFRRVVVETIAELFPQSGKE